MYQMVLKIEEKVGDVSVTYSVAFDYQTLHAPDFEYLMRALKRVVKADKEEPLS